MRTKLTGDVSETSSQGSSPRHLNDVALQLNATQRYNSLIENAAHRMEAVACFDALTTRQYFISFYFSLGGKQGVDLKATKPDLWSDAHRLRDATKVAAPGRR